MSDGGYKSSLIESLRGAGVPGATMGGAVQFIDFPWMQNTDVALRQRAAQAYLANPELLEFADIPYIPPAPRGSGSSAVPDGAPNPNTIGETIPERKAEPEVAAEEEAEEEPAVEEAAPQEPQTVREVLEQTVPVAPAPSPPRGTVGELAQKPTITIVAEPEVIGADSNAITEQEDAAREQAATEVANAIEPETVREVLEKLVPVAPSSNVQSGTLGELAPKSTITVVAEPEVIASDSNAITEQEDAANEQAEQEENTKQEESVPAEEMIAESQPQTQGSGGGAGLPFINSLSQEMALLAALGSSLPIKKSRVIIEDPETGEEIDFEDFGL